MTRIRDAACDAILAALDPLPEAAPALIPYRPTLEGDRDLLTVILGELESVALNLYPAWLPGAEDLPVAQVRSLACERARATGQSEQSGLFLADLAEAAVSRQPVVGQPMTHPLMTHPLMTDPPVVGPRMTDPLMTDPLMPIQRQAVAAAALAQVIAEGHRRRSAVLLVDVPPRLTERAEKALASALDRLATLSGMGVWLTGAPLVTVTRHPTVASPSRRAPG